MTLIFVKSKVDVYIFIKNLSGELHATHSSKFVKKKRYRFIGAMMKFTFG